MPVLGRLLIVDDEVELMKVLLESLTKQGFEVQGYTSGEEALAALSHADYDVLLTDLMMPGMDGLSLLRQAMALNPQLVGVVMTGQGTVPTAVEAIQIGAFDYILKPFTMRNLLPILTRALEVRQLRMENIQLRDTAAIHNLSQTIALTLDAKTIVERTADAVIQQYEGDEVSVMLWISNMASHQLEIAAVRGKNREGLLGQKVSVLGSIAGWVAEHQEAVTLTGAVDDERFAPLYPRADIRAAMSVPMQAGGQLIGVVNVNSLRLRQFTPGQVKALTVLASTAASALANGRLYTALQASEERFRALIENSSDAIILLDAKGTIKFASPATTQILGYSLTEIMGWNSLTLFHPEDVERAATQFRECLNAPGHLNLGEFRLRHCQGGWRWVEGTARNLLAKPSVGGVIINYHDITERKQAEAVVRASEAQYRELVELASDGITVSTSQGNYMEVNSSLCAMLGYTREEFLKLNVRQIVADLVENPPQYDYLRAGNNYVRERPYLHKSGEVIPVEISARMLSNGNFQAIIRDIRQRKQMQAALIQSEKDYRTLFENAPIGLYKTTAKGEILDANATIVKTFGFSERAAFLATNIIDFYVDPTTNDRFIREMEEHGVVAGFESEFQRQDGTTFWAEDYIRAVRDEAGTIVAYEGSLIDTTTRKQTQEAIRVSETKYRELVELASDGIALINPLGQIIEVNTRYREMSGYAREELLHMTLREIIDSKDLEQTPLDFRPVLAGETLLVERIWQRKDGTLLPVEISARQLPEGTIQAIIRDISERKKAETALRASAELLHLVVNSAPLVITAVDTQGIFTLSEGAGLRRTGRKPGEAVGLSAFEAYKSLQVIKSDGTRILGAEAFRQGLAGEALSGLAEVNGVPFSHTFSPLRDTSSQITGLVVTSIDLTDLKQADEKIRFQAHLLDTVGQAVIGTHLSGAIIYWNRFAETLYGWTAAEALGRNIIELTPSTTTADQAAEIFESLQAGRTWSGEFEVRRADGTTFPALVTDSPIHAEDGSLIGIVGVSSDISELKQREYELQALADANARLRSTESRAEMPALILDLLMGLFKAEGASLIIHDAPAAEWVVELGRGNLAEATGVRHPESLGLSGKIIASGEIYLTDNINADPNQLSLIPVPEHLSLAGAPLVVEGKTIGVLWVGRRAVTTQAEARLLMAIADITANAIQRATLHDETERRLSQLQALRAIDQAIKSSLDLHLTLGILLEHIVGQLRVDASAILLLNPHTLFLELAAGRGFRSKLPERIQVRLGEGYAGKAALERATIQISNLSERADNTRLMEVLAADDFVDYYAVPLIAKGQVQGVIEIFHRARVNSDDEWRAFLESLADQTAIAIDNAQLFSDLQRTNVELTLAYSATIEGWSRALDLRDKETEGHSQRVTQLTLELAHAMNTFSEVDFIHIRWGALLHDIGKMGIPDQILLKPGKLTDEEWEIMKRHPTYAFELLAPIAYLKPALDIPYCHHEKWDGSGYPRGLKGEQIPLVARLFAIVDVWDALRSDRPYRAAWSATKVREHIKSLSGTHFDPQVVELFFQVVQAT